MSAGGALLRGASAIIDFALFALTGLAVGTVLGRFMEPTAYAVFAAAFAAQVVLVQVHNGILAEPMLVLSAQRYATEPDAYLRALLRLHGVLSLVMLSGGGLAAAVALAVGSQGALHAALATCCAAPALTLMQLLRRVCYGRAQIERAALGGLAYLVAVALCLLGLQRADALSVLSSFACMAVVGVLVCAGWLAAWRLEKPWSGPRLPLRDVWAAHSQYASWGTWSALLGWVPSNAWYVLLPALAGGAGLHASAELRAVFNLVQPMMQVNAALGTMLVPALAARAARAGDGGRSAMLRWLALLVAASAAFAPVMLWLGPRAVQILYAGKYGVDTTTLLWLSSAPVCYAVFIVLKAWALSLGLPRLVFVASLVSGVGSATVGAALCARGTLADAALAIAIAFAVQAGTMAVLCVRPGRAAPVSP